jgi:hypothetical protein
LINVSILYKCRIKTWDYYAIVAVYCALPIK